MFWILSAALAIAATLAFVLPLLRKETGGAGDREFDRRLYEARLGEIDADLALGRISPVEAEAARAEEGRRLLAVAGSAAAPPQAASAPNLRIVAVALSLLIPLAAFGAYISIGQPGMPDMSLATRPDRDAAQQSFAQLIERAEQQLQKNPDDLRGWTVVAPIYLRLGRFDDAVRAWRNAVRLDEANADFRNSYGEALVAAAQGVVNEEARRQFEAALERQPGDPKARFYLAVGLGQEGALDQAEAAWRSIISDAPADAPWLSASKAQLAEILAKAGKPVDPSLAAAPPVSPGPTAEDVEAAAGMDAEDRQAMIEGMVGRLADRLKSEPADKDGWRRLIRAYAVMGRAEEGRAAVAEARGHFAADAAFLAELDTMQNEFGKDGATQ